MKISLLLLMTTISSYSFSSSKKYFDEKFHYRTSFGSCPSKAVGRLTLSLIKEFEKTRSLLSLKKKIVDENLEDKFYLSSYLIKFNPLLKQVRFEYDCPKALMKVQIYKGNGDEFYTAILVDNGELYDPTYEVLLRADKKIKKDLPNMALPASLINTDIHKRLTSLLNNLGDNFIDNISEIILSEQRELTMILSIGRKPSSAFFGKEFWSEKIMKLDDIVRYMKEKKTTPSVINLTNSKKAVIKFENSWKKSRKQ